MNRIAQAAIILTATLALAGCGSSVRQQATYGYSQGPATTAVPMYETVQPSVNPAQQTAAARSNTQISGFVDPAAAKLLSANSANQAAGAQYNALQFGRPGAPRAWQGDNGASGQVTVGPYVRVNTLDCRDFTHVVNVGGQSYTKQGTACREADGHWSVIGSATG